MKIALSEFEKHLGNVSFPLAVAVSGGGDSLALLLLANELALQKGSYVIALTVDHGLRHESKTEASQVKEWANKRAIKQVVLEWTGDNGGTRLQERARKARYNLLIEWCKAHEISTVLLGHHQQDQEETFWLRLSSGSGLDGLAGMKKSIIRDEIQFIRPLLQFPKERLKNTLLAENQEWIEDPSNQSALFFRGRLRHFLQNEGLSICRVGHVMKKLESDADFIQESLKKTLQKSVRVHKAGYLSIEKEAFYACHPAISTRFLSFLIQWFSGADYAPRSAQIYSVFDKLKKEFSFTTGGIYWTYSDNKILLFRERRAMQNDLLLSPIRKKILWDQRFWIDHDFTAHFPKDIIIAPLGCTSAVKKNIDYSLSLISPTGEIMNSCLKINDCSIENFLYETDTKRERISKKMNSLILKKALPTLPSLWEKGKVVAIPHLCYDILGCGKDLQKNIYLKSLFHDSSTPTI